MENVVTSIRARVNQKLPLVREGVCTPCPYFVLTLVRERDLDGFTCPTGTIRRRRDTFDFRNQRAIDNRAQSSARVRLKKAQLLNVSFGCRRLGKPTGNTARYIRKTVRPRPLFEGGISAVSTY